METFSALLALCVGNSPVTGGFTSQRSIMRNFAVFFDLRLNKRLSKQSSGWWLETPSRSLWLHCNVDERMDCFSDKTMAMSSKPSPLRKFLETTSIKGVTRTFKSRGCVFRVLWGSSVILGLATTTYFLIGLLTLFISNSTTLSVTQVRDGSHLAFPSVTLCNLNPLANTDITEREIYELYHLRHSENVTWSADDQMYLELLLSPASIFENLIYGRPNERTRNFIVACRWNEGFLYDEDLCMGNSERAVYDTPRGFCYTFRPPEEMATISAFSAIVYIDNTVDVLLPNYDMSVASPYSSGALLALHRDSVPPDLKKALALEVGYDTNIQLRKSCTYRIQTPTSTCVDQNQSDAKHDRDTCIATCFQKHIILACGCIDGRFSSSQEARSTINFCSDVHHSNSSLHDFIARMQCVERVTSDLSLCDIECPEMCYSEHIELTASKVSWPHPSYQLSLYDRYIHHQPYGGRFRNYQDITHVAQTDPETAFNMLEEMNKMEQNFLQVSEHRMTGLIRGLRPANERRRYFVTTSLIGWAQT